MWSARPQEITPCSNSIDKDWYVEINKKIIIIIIILIIIIIIIIIRGTARLEMRKERGSRIKNNKEGRKCFI